MVNPGEMAGLQDEIERLRARVNDLSTLIEVSALIGSTLDLDELIALVMEKAQAVMRAEASSVLLVNEEINKLECKLALGEVGDQIRGIIHLDKGQGLAGWVWEHQKPLNVPNVGQDERFFSGIDQQSGFTTRSVLSVPLTVRNRIIGVAQVINRRDGEPFSEQDVDLFTTFCRHVALAIENARMHLIALEQERIQLQLQLAWRVQRSFMPQTLPVSRSDSFHLAASSIPAVSVGGDFYDAIRLDKEHLALIIGDVSGKGIPAALFMARMMSDFRFYVQQTPEPLQLIEKLNQQVVQQSQSGLFVTVQYLVVDLLHGVVDFCDAGHLPMIQIPASGASSDSIAGIDGGPLGIFADLSFKAQRVQLQPGDFLFLYTDGLIEAQNDRQEAFTLERLQRRAAHRWTDCDQLLQTLLDEVGFYSRGIGQHDDMTAMAFQWLRAPG